MSVTPRGVARTSSSHDSYFEIRGILDEVRELVHK